MDNETKGPEDFENEIEAKAYEAVEGALETPDYGQVLDGMTRIRQRAAVVRSSSGETYEETTAASVAHDMSAVSSALEGDMQNALNASKKALGQLHREGLQLMQEFDRRAASIEARIKDVMKVNEIAENALQSLRASDTDE